MLDYGSIIEREISGLSTDELDFVQRIGHREPGQAISQWSGLTARHQSLIDAELANPTDLQDLNFLRELSEAKEGDLRHVEDEAKRQSTVTQTELHVKRLKQFLRDQHLPDAIESMPERYLCSYLRLWFVSLRTADGKLYAVRSLVCFRASIHRYILQTRNMQIIGNIQFASFERTYKACLAAALKEKKLIGAARTYCPIDDADFVRLRTYFDRSTPTRLQMEVLFKIVYGFGFRGREWLRDLEKTDLKIKECDGVRYVDVMKTRVEKAISVDNPTTLKSIILAETPNDPATCPVRAVELYLSKIPADVDCLWPKPLQRGYSANGYWYYDSLVLGKNWLNNFMKTLCELAGLGCRNHTNHCIRASVVTNLVEDGVSVQQIQVVTGHKREESVQHYNKRLKFSRKVELSRTISSRLSSASSSTSQIADRSIGESTMAAYTTVDRLAVAATPSSAIANCSVAIGVPSAGLPNIFSNCQFENCTINVNRSGN